MVRAIVEDDDDVQALGFIGSVAIDEPVTQVADMLRNLLDFEADPPKGITSANQRFGDALSFV